MIGIEIEVSYEGVNKEVTIISAKGYIDNTTAPDIDRVIDEQLASGLFKIIVNLEGVNYISSAGWGVFVSDLSEIRENKGDIVLVNMSPNVHNVFELMEFSSILKSFDSMDRAVAYFLGANVRQIQSEPARPQMSVENKTQSVIDISASHRQEYKVPESPALQEVKPRSSEILTLTHSDLGRKILKVIIDYPYFNIKEITRALRLPQYGGKKVRKLAVKRELKFMDLKDQKKRFEFAMRNRH